jgi:hypothetical protein
MQADVTSFCKTATVVQEYDLSYAFIVNTKRNVEYAEQLTNSVSKNEA